MGVSRFPLSQSGKRPEAKNARKRIKDRHGSLGINLK
jgi:hypothetical protein